MAPDGHQIHAHDNTNTRRRTKIEAHKLERQLFGMDLRDIRTGSQDDAKERNYLDVCEISNYGKEV